MLQKCIVLVKQGMVLPFVTQCYTRKQQSPFNQNDEFRNIVLITALLGIRVIIEHMHLVILH